MAYFTMAKEAFFNLFRKPVCHMYPVVLPEYPLGTRGHIVNAVSSCIFCGICQKKCPTDAITVDRAAKTWQINRLQCIACGSCSEACPKKCISVQKGYAAPVSAADKASASEVLKADEPAASDAVA